MLVEFSRRASGVIALALAMLPVSALAAQQQQQMATLTGSADEPFAISYAEVEKIPEAFRRQEVPYETSHAQGTLIVDTGARFLYLVLEDGRALRYGIAVGRDGSALGINGKAARDRNHPGERGCLRRIELAGAAPDLQIGFLHDIRGHLTAAHDPQHHAVELGARCRVEPLECGGISLGDGAQQRRDFNRCRRFNQFSAPPACCIPATGSPRKTPPP